MASFKAKRREDCGRNVWMSGCLDVWMSGCLDVWMSRVWAITTEITMNDENLHQYKKLSRAIGIFRVDYFDVVRFRCSSASRDLNLAALRTLCESTKAQTHRVPYGPVWKSQVEVYRPTKAWFREFEKQVGRFCRVETCYAEVSRDFVTRFLHEAASIRRFFLGSAVVRFSRHCGEPFENSFYIPVRNGVTFTAYADRNKLHRLRGRFQGRPCSHFEVRICGQPALRACGLMKPQDFVMFDFDEFWDGTMTMYEPPSSKAALGELLSGKRKVSGTALRKRVDRLSRPISLHNLQLENVGMLKRLCKRSMTQWEEMALDHIWDLPPSRYWYRS